MTEHHALVLPHVLQLSPRQVILDQALTEFLVSLKKGKPFRIGTSNTASTSGMSSTVSNAKPAYKPLPFFNQLIMILGRTGIFYELAGMPA